MNTERKIQRVNRKHCISVLNEILDMLNMISTRVELANETMLDKKYLVTNGNDKMVLDVTAGAILVSKYRRDIQVMSFTLHKDDVCVKAKAWLVEFNLQRATEKPLVARLVEKLKNRQH